MESDFFFSKNIWCILIQYVCCYSITLKIISLHFNFRSQSEENFLVTQQEPQHIYMEVPQQQLSQLSAHETFENFISDDESSVNSDPMIGEGRVCQQHVMISQCWFFSSKNLSIIRESNPGLLSSRQAFYHRTKVAQLRFSSAETQQMKQYAMNIENWTACVIIQFKDSVILRFSSAMT